MFDADGIDEHEPEAPGAGVLWDALATAAGDSLDVLAHLDPTVLDASTVAPLVLGLERMRRSLDAAEAHLLSSLVDAEATERSEGLATSRWLAREAKLRPADATSRVRVATRLANDLDDVDDALSAGRIGQQHAAAFAAAINPRNRTAMLPFIGHFITQAQHCGYARWRRDLDALAELLDPDGPDPQDPNNNRLTFSPTNGYSLFRGELHGDNDLIVRQTINTVADELFRQYSRDREQFPDQQIPPRATLRALALVEIARRATAIDPAQGPRTDATIIIHTNRCDAPAGASGEDRVPPDPATPPAARVAPTATAPDGRHISVHTAAFLLCAAVTRVLTVTSDGRPIAETPTHDPTRSQRRALAARDGGCTFPGCTAPTAWCDAHHIVSYPTGPTTLDNLTLLCRHHHRVAHRRGWTLTLIDGWTHWTSPDLTRRWGQRHHRQRAGP